MKIAVLKNEIQKLLGYLMIDNHKEREYQNQIGERKEVWKGWNNPPTPHGRQLPCAHLISILHWGFCQVFQINRLITRHLPVRNWINISLCISPFDGLFLTRCR